MSASEKNVATPVTLCAEYERLLANDHAELSTLEGQERVRAEIENKFREIICAPRKDDPANSDAELSEVEQLRQRIAELEDENMKLRWGHLPPSAAQVASKLASETSPAQLPENVVPFSPAEPPKYHSTRTADRQPPRHYLREGQSREPWCDNSGGVLVPPYFPLDPYQ
jgi:hypothetical protein